jgi:sugar lactone lactonase YvrE
MPYNKMKFPAIIILALFSLLFAASGILQAAVMPNYVRLKPVTAKLTDPTALALDSYENLYVTESSNHRLFKYSQSGKYMKTLSGLQRPISVAVDSSGRIYIGNSDGGNEQTVK